MKERENIIILSDNPNFNIGLALHINQSSSNYNIETFLCANLDTDAIAQNDPKVIIIDVLFPEMKELEIIQQLKENSSEAQFLAIVSQPDNIATLELINSKIHGIISYLDELNSVIDALSHLETDGSYLGLSIRKNLFTDYLSKESEAISKNLTTSESALLKEIASGVSSIESCDTLNLTTENYNIQRESILKKTDCTSNSGLALYTIMTLGVKNQ